VRTNWLPQATEFIRGIMKEHQEDANAINEAVRALPDGPESAEGFHSRDYHRLRVGPYRVHCIVEGDVINIVRADRVPGT
jgi:hypothetical protein